jgi:acyl carrier protein
LSEKRKNRRKIMSEITINQESVSFDDFCQIAAQRLKVDLNLLRPEALWVQDVGITSVDIVKIALLLRQKFGVKVPTSKVGGIKTVRDAYQLIGSGTSNE